MCSLFRLIFEVVPFFFGVRTASRLFLCLQNVVLFVEPFDSPEKAFKSGIVALMLHHELTLAE